MKYCDSRIIYNLQPEWKWHIFLKAAGVSSDGAIEAVQTELCIDGIINCGAVELGLMIKHFNSFCVVILPLYELCRVHVPILTILLIL